MCASSVPRNIAATEIKRRPDFVLVPPLLAHCSLPMPNTVSVVPHRGGQARGMASSAHAGVLHAHRQGEEHN